MAEQAEVLGLTSQFEKAISSLGYPTVSVPVSSEDIDTALAQYDPLEYVVFNWCESLPGIAHSEWLVAKYLEKRGFVFTGAGSAAIALAQDKIRIKQLLDHSGIATPKWRIYNKIPSVIRWNSFPAIVKLAKEHCSEGIDHNSVVNDETELIERVRFILEKYRQPALVEDFIDGREFHVSLWGNTAEILPPAEMGFSSIEDIHDRLCSYEAKFVPGSNCYENIKTLLPAPLSEDELYSLEDICKATYEVTGCRDYARIDLRMKDGIFYVLDVNPNSDISPDTSTIAAAELAGYSYGEFGERIIHLAAKRHPVWGKHITVSNVESTINTSLKKNY